MLNSAEHEILNAHKSEIQHFPGSDKPRMLFSLLINVKKPTSVGILSFMSKTIFMLSIIEHKNLFIIFYNLGDFLFKVTPEQFSSRNTGPNLPSMLLCKEMRS